MANKSNARTMIGQHPYFADLNKPNGWLDPHPACHALFYYTILMKKKLDEVKLDIRYAGDPTMKLYPMNLFKSCSIIYGVKPEEMNNYQANVDLQCFAMGSPRLPDTYRFNQSWNISTKGYN
jgi:hypothetical protein